MALQPECLTCHQEVAEFDYQSGHYHLVWVIVHGQVNHLGI